MAPTAASVSLGLLAVDASSDQLIDVFKGVDGHWRRLPHRYRSMHNSRPLSTASHAKLGDDAELVFARG
jgi:hypothetical protein